MIIGPVGTIELLRNATYTTTQTTATGVDISNYIGRSVRATVFASAFTTIATCTCAVVECATSGGSYTAPPNGTTSVVFTAAGMKNLDFAPTKQFVRLTYTMDAGGSMQMAAVLIATPRVA